jgi:N-acyl-D-aspartate/D-glutamate deacylase
MLMSAFDLVIRGGTVVNGSGGEPFEADVAIAGGRIVAVGAVTGTGREELDARDRVVTPGFIDVHTHYDGQVTWEHRLAPSSDHGVTTIVMGNCGVGFAPCRVDDHELLVKLMEGVEDIPDAVMTAGVPWDWETFPDYLDTLSARHADIDFAAQLPHSPLRVYVMGQRGADLEPPTEDDVAQMRRLTAEAVRAGAIGVSTSRTLAHRFRDGRPAPSVGTEEAEVLALAAGLKDAGRGVFQMVPDMDIDAEKRFSLLRRIAQVSGRPVSFTFLEKGGTSDESNYLLEELERARRDGLTIRGQIIPRPVGALLGLQLSYNPFSLNPSYQAIASAPLDRKVRELRNPELRARLIAETPQDPNPFFMFIVGDLEEMFVLGDPPNYHPSRQDSVACQAREQGLNPREFIYDALLRREGREILYRPMGNCGGERYEAAGRNLLKRDLTILGLGDGGAHYSLICDAAYPTYLLTYWSRDAVGDGQLPLPWAIKKLTSETATAVGMNDRGLLMEGYKADVNVINLKRLRLHAPHAVYDLPAGGRRLRQKADGYDATIVSGEITYRDGKPTGALPGRLVRSRSS